MVCVPVVITPLAVALASGTFNVITGVVVPVATDELKSVPDVPNVKAATLVTVPVPLPTPAILPLGSLTTIVLGITVTEVL